MFPCTNLADEPKVRCRCHQPSWLRSIVSCMTRQPLFGVVPALDRQRVDGDVEAGLEGDDLGPLRSIQKVRYPVAGPSSRTRLPATSTPPR